MPSSIPFFIDLIERIYKFTMGLESLNDKDLALSVPVVERTMH